MQKSERFEMRLDPMILQQVETWRAEQPDRPSRAEAVRRLVNAGLAVSGKDEVRFSAGEKLILGMLCDLHKHHDVSGETDSDFVIEAICRGHYWAFKWELSGLFEGHVDDPQVVSEVVETLNMWDHIEAGYQRLSEEEKLLVDAEVHPFSGPNLFRGFDGNNESEHLAIASFLVDRMNRFRRFKGRDLNSHWPSLDSHRQMRVAFEPMKPNLIGGSLSASLIISLLKAQFPPEREDGS
jgi:uncharacterized protein YfbU (UPF0304 family)